MTAGPDAAPAEARVLLDVTGLPKPQRHRTIIATLEAVEPGVALLLVNDHEPEPLHRQLERRYGDLLGWEPKGRSGDRVAVEIRLEAAR